MIDLVSMGIQLRGGVLTLLDQQMLPGEERWIECRSLETMTGAIQSLKVRGAPAIGIAAVLFLASHTLEGARREDVMTMSAALRVSRPTAVNLMNYLDRIDRLLAEPGESWRNRLCGEAQSIFEEDVALCESIARNGAALLPRRAQVLTHCNTGGLATAGRGTALGVITRAHEEGREIHVWVDETRPLLQGARLTAWELGKSGIPHTLICDNAAGMLMQAGRVDCVLVGADRIAMNGDFANKIGTYSLAVLARHHGIPFYVAAPETTLDIQCANGAAIPIEERRAEEVRGLPGHLRQPASAPAAGSGVTPVFNPAFDVTPAALVNGWIFDTGVRRAGDWAKIGQERLEKPSAIREPV